MHQKVLQLCKNYSFYLNKLILSPEVSVTAEPVAVGFDEVGLLLHVQVFHFFHRRRRQ